jgi:hypothetical protein
VKSQWTVQLMMPVIMVLMTLIISDITFSPCQAFHHILSEYITRQQSTNGSTLDTTSRLLIHYHHHHHHHLLSALSNAYLENDLVSVKVPPRLLVTDNNNKKEPDMDHGYRFCVVRQDSTVVPLCRHEDDVETDLFIDPRTLADQYWQKVTDDTIGKTYGEGWYGQRPVPS